MIKTVQILVLLISCMLSLVTLSYSAVGDEKLVQMAQRELKAHLESRPTASEWVVTTNLANKIVETNWYREHKGEVILRAEIRVQDGLVRVDVWQRTGYLIHSEVKTEWSRRIEWNIQNRIEQAKAQIK